MQFISPAVLHDKSDYPQTQKPLSKSLFNYLKAMKNQKNIRFVKIKAKETKSISTQKETNSGVYKLETDINIKKDRDVNLEINTRGEKKPKINDYKAKMKEEKYADIDTIEVDDNNYVEFGQVFQKDINNESLMEKS
mmetsp:Transcript_29483/g.26060  ORF Transcript_29483/g.26060 Transcript_29483/m.26060 type:complete len:137 (-) Transcript_29483:26-436(-)